MILQLPSSSRLRQNLENVSNNMLFQTINNKINDINTSLTTNNNTYCRRYLKFYQNREEIIVNQELLDEFYHYVKYHQKFADDWEINPL